MVGPGATNRGNMVNLIWPSFLPFKEAELASRSVSWLSEFDKFQKTVSYQIDEVNGLFVNIFQFFQGILDSSFDPCFSSIRPIPQILNGFAHFPGTNSSVHIPIHLDLIPFIPHFKGRECIWN
jgi:hypothetical protein